MDKYFILIIIIIVFISVFLILFSFSVMKFFEAEKIKYEKELSNLEYKKKKIDADIVKANLELAKTYENLSSSAKGEEQELQNQFQSFGKAIDSSFEEILKGDD